MKFVRVFALLIALATVLNGLQEIANLVVVDSYFDKGEVFWLSLIQIVAAVGFGFGAYALTEREEV